MTELEIELVKQVVKLKEQVTTLATIADRQATVQEAEAALLLAVERRLSVAESKILWRT